MAYKPISMSIITKRKLELIPSTSISESSVSDVTKFKANLTPSIVENFLKRNNNSSVINSDNCCSILKTFEEYCKLEDVTESQILKSAKYLTENIIPKVKNLDLFETKINESSIPEQYKKLFIDSVSVYENCDRVLYNIDTLHKRFNLDKVICTHRGNNIDDLIFEICELFDTYSLPLKSKYNLALECILYSMYKNGKDLDRSVIVEDVTDYFLSRDIIMTDSDYQGIQKVLKTNRFISGEDYNKVKYMNSDEHLFYSDKVLKFINSCENKKVKDHLYSALRIKTEKDASKYIERTIAFANNDKSLNEKDQKMLYLIIGFIPLIAPVNKLFIDKEFNKSLNSIANIPNLLDSSNILHNIVDNEEDTVDEYDIADTDLLEVAKIVRMDLKSIIEKFRTEQDKSIDRFKELMNFVYHSNENDILEEIPNIFNLIRYLFILSPTIDNVMEACSCIDILTDVLLDKIDKDSLCILSDKILIEKEKVEKKLLLINDDFTKNKASKYKECLSSNLVKICNYLDAIIPDTVEYDVVDESNFEDSCNTLLYLSETIANLCDIDKDNLLNSIESNIQNIIHADGLEDICKLVVNCSTLVDISEFTNILNSYRETTSYKESTQIINILDKMYSFKETGNNIIEDTMIETEAGKELNALFINEAGVNINTIKLGLVNFKKSIQKIKTKEKSMWQSVDAAASVFVRSLEKAMTSDRREAIIKGSIIPSFSKCIKTSVVIGSTTAFNPVLGLITALGIFGSSKALNRRERILIYDEIETELKVVDKQINIAENDGDMNQYRFLLTYQKKLQREKQRIKYGMAATGRDIPRTAISREGE